MGVKPHEGGQPDQQLHDPMGALAALQRLSRDGAVDNANGAPEEMVKTIVSLARDDGAEVGARVKAVATLLETYVAFRSGVDDEGGEDVGIPGMDVASLFRFMAEMTADGIDPKVSIQQACMHARVRLSESLHGMHANTTAACAAVQHHSRQATHHSRQATHHSRLATFVDSPWPAHQQRL